jgi:hypothetical protein
MHDIFSREPDPLDGMLRPPSPPDNEALHQAVYCRTRRVLHRRRRVRQFAYAAALLVSFAAGLLAMRLATPASIRSPDVVVTPPKEPPPPDKLPTPPSPPPQESALAQEWRAFDSLKQRAALYREAGTHYMKEENDPQSALRCFSTALDNGTEEDLAISSDDNWLFMAIKDARLKEKNHAKQGG